MKELIQQLAKTGDEIYAKICKVISVNEQKQTADLKPLDGSSEILDANVQVGEQGVFVQPKVGSLVACVFVTKEIAIIVNHSEVDWFSVEISSTKFKVDKDGFLLKKENETLKKLMADLLKAIKAMKFTTNQGPTIKLINEPDFIKLEKRFNSFLKDS